MLIRSRNSYVDKRFWILSGTKSHLSVSIRVFATCAPFCCFSNRWFSLHRVVLWHLILFQLRGNEGTILRCAVIWTLVGGVIPIVGIDSLQARPPTDISNLQMVTSHISLPIRCLGHRPPIDKTWHLAYILLPKVLQVRKRFILATSQIWSHGLCSWIYCCIHKRLFHWLLR